MSSDNYTAHRVMLKKIDFEVLVLEIPDDELEEKLAYFARDKGHISKSFYDDFLIAHCIGNVSQLLYHLNKHLTQQNMMEIRDELIGVILKHNKNLDPEKVYINKNFVLKVNKDGSELEEGCKVLVENPNWDVSYYDETMNIYGVIDEEGDEEPKTIDEQKDDDYDSKGMEELQYEIVNKWWKRLSKYIPIKKYSKRDSKTILGQRNFHDRSSFGVYIVSVCVENFEELFELLDSMGIPERVAPPILMNELYKLCLQVNPFLTLENANIINPTVADDDDDDCSGSCHTSRNNQRKSSMSKYVKNKPKVLFKDIKKKDLLSLNDNIKKQLVGQDTAIDELAEAIQRASIGLKDPERPIGSFLFAGRTGVGKTLATKVLADELIKGDDNIITIDCSEYTADHEYSKLIGAPAGYVGHEQGGMLTNAITKNPFRVVVFDEVEKASHKVHELLLQVLEEGRLTDGKGKTVSFNNAIVIMTSNVGVKEVDEIGKTIGFGDAAKLTDDKKDKALDKALKNKFKPEFLNRIDSIVNFRILIKKDYMRIIDLELNKLTENLKKNDTEYKNLTLKFDKKLKNLIYKEGINEEFGARPLKRCIEKVISTPLAKTLLKNNVRGNSIVNISVKKDKAVFDIETVVDEPPFYVKKPKNKTKKVGK